MRKTSARRQPTVAASYPDATPGESRPSQCDDGPAVVDDETVDWSRSRDGEWAYEEACRQLRSGFLTYVRRS